MLEKFEHYFRIIGGKNGRSKYGISARARARRVVFSIKEPLLTLKQFTYNGHPPPTTRLKSLSKSLWNCPINCDYYSILGVKIFKEVWGRGGKEVCDSCQCEAIVTISSKRVLLRDKYRAGSRYLPIQRQRMRIYGIPQDTEDRSPSVFFRVMENT